MATLSTIRDGLKARLSTVSGLHVHDVAPPSITAPAAVVTYASPLLVRDSQTTWSIRLVVTLYLGLQYDPAAQDNMDAYLDTSSAGSVIAAIESGSTALGGGGDYAIVAEVREPGIATVAGTEYLACELLIAIGAT